MFWFPTNPLRRYVDFVEEQLKQTQRVSMKNNKNSDEINEDSLTDNSVNAATPIPKKYFKGYTYSGLLGHLLAVGWLLQIFEPRLHKIAPLQSQNITEKNISLLTRGLKASFRH